MESLLAVHEGAIRLSVFATLLVGFALLEIATPRSSLSQSKAHRWTTNLLLSGANTLTLRLLFPILAVGVAHQASNSGWGLFNLIDAPWAIAFLASLLFLDAAIYAQHIAFHKIPVFWRLHRAHHADRDFDVTTAVRFHPIEIALSMVIKIVLVLILGPPPEAVIAFEIILNGTSLFNHSNIAMNEKVERWLRFLVVTPDMHRIHHSVEPSETNSNFGFNLSIWDRCFGTYVNDAACGKTGIDIGLPQYRDNAPSRFFWTLALPFARN
jgi:sterol desaturase/sphingolipid hydroxylase (fatty acid hydroxylase superfamily)